MPWLYQQPAFRGCVVRHLTVPEPMPAIFTSALITHIVGYSHPGQACPELWSATKCSFFFFWLLPLRVATAGEFSIQNHTLSSEFSFTFNERRHSLGRGTVHCLPFCITLNGHSDVHGLHHCTIQTCSLPNRARCFSTR